MKVAAILALVLLAGGASAQSWPARPVRVVVPWPPGGGNDLVARPIAQKLQENLKQAFVVENRGGANSIIGSDAVAKSAPDGYTMMVNSVSAMTINEVYYTGLPYKLATDFAPVSRITWWTHALVAHPSFPAKSLADVIALAKAKPGQIAFASFGTASTAHLGGELLNVLAGVQLLHVPYKGGGPAMTDLLGGQVPLYLTTLPPAMAHLQSGKARALAVTSAKRSQYLPDVPTFAETPGLESYELNAHYGIWMPAGTPAEVIARLNAELGKVLAAPDVRERMKALGAEETASSTPEELARLVREEIPLWTKIAKAANIRPEALK